MSEALTKPSERIRDYSRLSSTETLLILRLANEGHTQTKIAQQIGCDQSTVSRVLHLYSDTRDLAKLRIHNSAVSLAERVIKDADVDQALEVLDRVDVAPKKRNDSNTHIQLAVVNMPGQQKYKAEDIPVNVIANYQTPEVTTSVDSLCKPVLTEGEGGE